MKSGIIATVLCLLFFAGLVSGQTLLTPGQVKFNESGLRNSKAEFAYYAVDNGQQVEIGNFFIETKLTDEQFTVATELKLHSNANRWIDTSISDRQSLRPVYRSSVSPEKKLVLRYGTEVKGEYLDKNTGKKAPIRHTVEVSFFDSYLYPYMLSLLPLTTGYKADISVFEFKPGQSKHVKRSRIEEVVNNLHKSPLTGEHKVWKLSVFEEATNDRYTYYIDKEDGRIWKIDIQSKNTRLVLINREIDYNPFKNKFNKAETLKLIQEGSASISGQAFARDNQNEGLFKGMAILNVNKKQFAREGTSIILIPYTAFFEEWIKLNEKLRKEGRAVPLPPEAAECIKTTTVYGEDGQFEFTNLMPGEYLLYTEFGYTHTSVRTEVVGYTDTYINGMFAGSSPRTNTYRVGSSAVAGIKKIVEIKKAGETVKVKLKKTL